MLWIEMSREPEERSEKNRMGTCLVSPKYKDNGQTWGFWETMKSIDQEDIVLHLCGKGDEAVFTGYSEVESRVFETVEKNSDEVYYRVPLINYTKFDQPINLYTIFKQQKEGLQKYFLKNKSLSTYDKERLFYVIQNKKLQCLNGAYLSELSNELANILFGKDFSEQASDKKIINISVKTASQLRNIKTRTGHTKFANNVKENFNYTCAFPGCQVNENSFLIGSHIARWADNEELRGDTSNGICLCVFHDKAFENGFFTLDSNMKITVNKKKTHNYPFLKDSLDLYESKKIKTSKIVPSIEALKSHWKRIKFSP